MTGFRDIPYLRDQPERVFRKADTSELRQLIKRYAEEPLGNRAFLGCDRYFIESVSGQWVEAFASGLTLSREHISRIDILENDKYAVLMMVFSVEDVPGCRSYGMVAPRPIYVEGVKIGEVQRRIVKMRLYYQDVKYLASGRADTKTDKHETFYEHKEHIPVEGE